MEYRLAVWGLEAAGQCRRRPVGQWAASKLVINHSQDMGGEPLHTLQQHSTPMGRQLGLKKCKLLEDKIQSQEGRKACGAHRTCGGHRSHCRV